MTKVAEATASVAMAPPTVPVISNVTGKWYSDADRADPAYWAKQVRAPVRFAEGLDLLISDNPRAFVEIGPAATLIALVTTHQQRTGSHQARSVLPPRTGQLDDMAYAQSTLAWLGAVGSVASQPIEGSEVQIPSLSLEDRGR